MTNRKWRRFDRRAVSGTINGTMLPPHYRPDWFSKSFNEEYELIYRYTDDTAPREVKGCLRYLGMPNTVRRDDDRPVILDVGCGWGRHALQFVLRGYRVVGLDLSEHMLNRAVAEAAKIGIDVKRIEGGRRKEVLSQYESWRASKSPLLYVWGDMRKMSWDQQFEVVTNLFTSFGYFATAKENRQVLDGIVRSLIPGGQLVLDVDNAPQFVRRRQGTSSVTITGTDSKGHEVLRKQEYDVDRGRRVVEYLTEDSGDSIYLECELYDYDDLRMLLEAAGLAVKAVWGDFDGQKYDARVSPRLIIVGAKVRIEGDGRSGDK